MTGRSHNQAGGFEADAYRVYSDFYSRFDYASTYIGEMKDVHFIPTAFDVQSERYDLIMQFFPFIFVKDHLEWGLPKAMFNPEKLLKSIIVSLKTGGY